MRIDCSDSEVIFRVAGQARGRGTRHTGNGVDKGLTPAARPGINVIGAVE